MRIPSLMGMNTLLFDDRKRDYLVFEHVLQQMLKENET